MDLTMVRIGELATSGTQGHVLSSIGLGSCIGLALLDPASGVAGLAHIMLPSSDETPSRLSPAKYADRGVPALVAEMSRLGACNDLKAVLVGGAQMFNFGKGNLEIGARNEAAVRSALADARIDVLAAATGGSTGRTIRVIAGDLAVTVRETGGTDAELYAPRQSSLAVR